MTRQDFDIQLSDGEEVTKETFDELSNGKGNDEEEGPTDEQ